MIEVLLLTMKDFFWKRKTIVLSVLLVFLLASFTFVFFAYSAGISIQNFNLTNSTSVTPTPSVVEGAGLPSITPDPKGDYYNSVLETLDNEETVLEPITAIEGSTFFYRGLNLGGEEIVIDGNTLMQGKFPSNDFEFDGSVLLDDYSGVIFTPEIKDQNKIQMFKDFIWHGTAPFSRFKMKNIENGKYLVYLYVYEDTEPTFMDIYINRKVNTKGLITGEKGEWKKFGPFAAETKDNSIEILSTSKDINFSGIELYDME